MSQTTKAIALFCVLPTLFGLGSVVFAAIFAEQILVAGGSGLPIVFIALPLVGIGSLAVFVAHFNRSVPNALAWSAIALNGALTILLFAIIQARVGIMCESTVCPGTILLSADAAYIDFRPGSEFPPLEPATEPSLDAVSLDQRFWTGLYFSVVSFTTLGYGDFQPLPGMRLLAALEAVLGYLFLGLVVGSLIDLGNALRDRAREQEVHRLQDALSKAIEARDTAQEAEARQRAQIEALEQTVRDNEERPE